MPPSAPRSSSAQEAQHLQESTNGDNIDPPVADIKTSPPAKIKLISRLLPTIVLTVLTGLWSVAGRIPIRVVGQSILLQPRSIISFQPRGSGGQVLEIRVRPGDRVQVGDVLGILDLPELREQLITQKQKLAEYELENLAITSAQERRSALQQQMIELESFSVPQQIQSNLLQIEANRIERIAVEKQRQAYQERIAQLNDFISLTEGRLEAGETLVQEGVIVRFSVSLVNAENDYQQSQNERTRLFASLEDLSARDKQLIIVGDGQVSNLVVEISNPQLQGDQLTYDVQILQGKPPATGGTTSLFIDGLFSDRELRGGARGAAVGAIFGAAAGDAVKIYQGQKIIDSLKVPQLRQQIQLYTYASPRVGDSTFATLHSKQVPNSSRNYPVSGLA